MPRHQRLEKIKEKLAALREQAKNPNTQTTILQVSVDVKIVILLYEFMIEHNKMNLSGIVSDILSNRLRDVGSVKDIDPAHREFGIMRRRIARLEKKLEKIELELSTIEKG